MISKVDLSEERLRSLAQQYDAGHLVGYLTYPPFTRWNNPIDANKLSSLCTDAVRDDGSSGAYLYFHFPYCRTLCTYCSCFMRVTSKPEEQYDGYLVGMEKELEQKLGGGGGRVRVGDMHWGGGTPTLMTNRQIERIHRRIDDLVEWTGGGERSVEAYPDRAMMTDDKLQLIKDLGFTRISFGLESTDPKVLQAINRSQRVDDIAYLFDKAREIGLGVHTDVVYGLPHQTLESVKGTLTTIIENRPDRLDTFAFLYAPSVVPHQAAIAPTTIPGSYERVKLYQLLDAMMQDAGYNRVGIDHYTLRDEDPLTRAARDGSLVFGLNGYEPAGRGTFLGFGSSAVSFVGDTYFANVSSVGQYLGQLSKGTSPVDLSRSHRLGTDDQIRHRVILTHLFCHLGIDKPSLEKDFGIRFDEYFEDTLPALQSMEQNGLLSGVGSDFIRLTELGRPFFRRICAQFDAMAVALARLGRRDLLNVTS